MVEMVAEDIVVFGPGDHFIICFIDGYGVSHILIVSVDNDFQAGSFLHICTG